MNRRQTSDLIASETTGYCSDCENKTTVINGRCGCGSGRVVTSATSSGKTGIDASNASYSTGFYDGVQAAAAIVDGLFDEDGFPLSNRSKIVDAIKSAATTEIQAIASTKEQTAVMVGMAMAAAIVVRSWDKATYAQEILAAAGVDNFETLKAIGVEQYDLDVIAPILPVLEGEDHG